MAKSLKKGNSIPVSNLLMHAMANYRRSTAAKPASGGSTYRGGNTTTNTEESWTDSGDTWDGGGGGGGGGGGWDGGAAAAKAAATAKARAASQRQNDQTRAAADAKFALGAKYASQRDVKLGNVDRGYKESDSSLLKNYRTAAEGFDKVLRDNKLAEGDATFSNVTNTLRERSNIMSEVASQGAGESDTLMSQLQALRNHDANQQEINRSFFDTQTSTNRAIDSLNIDTQTNRKNIWDKMQSDRDTVHTNYNNQMADLMTEIFNIENANTNVEDEETVGYVKKYTNASKDMARYAGSQFKKAAYDTKLNSWDGKSKTEEAELAKNKAQTVTLNREQRRPEGATLRKW